MTDGEEYYFVSGNTLFISQQYQDLMRSLCGSTQLRNVAFSHAEWDEYLRRCEIGQYVDIECDDPVDDSMYMYCCL